ncbi:MAG: hypothetical protein KJ626_15645 [Verrucomicrobia bacterium]|nr:hypothetical protein [Verrucomicrobiota bacterium]
MIFPGVLIVCAALLVSTAQSYGETRDVRLTIGQGWAVVREVRMVHMIKGEQVITFEDIPQEAELPTLVIRSRRIPVRLLEWGRIGQLEEEPAGAGSLVYRRVDDSVVWEPKGFRRSSDERSLGLRDAVRCLIDAESAGKRELELVYMVRGLSWDPHYEVVVRGELEKEPKVAVDIHAQVKIRNNCSRSFKEAVVHLVGRTPDSLSQRKDPGFLVTDPHSPLAELWKKQQEPSDPGYSYPIPQAVDIPRQAETEVTYVRTQRVPAKRIYYLGPSMAGRLELGANEPLQKIVAFNNAEAHGLGLILPPGPVDIFLGSKRRHVRQTARLPRTTVNSEIRIDLGDDPDVTARRTRLGRSALVDGAYEEVHEILIENRTPFEASAEIDERPSSTLGWDLIRATGVHEQEGQTLRFMPRVAASDSKMIQYRLRIRQPEL